MAFCFHSAFQFTIFESKLSLCFYSSCKHTSCITLSFLFAIALHISLPFRMNTTSFEALIHLFHVLEYRLLLLHLLSSGCESFDLLNSSENTSLYPSFAIFLLPLGSGSANDRVINAAKAITISRSVLSILNAKI